MIESFLYSREGESKPILQGYARQVANFRSWQRLSAYLFYAAKKIEPELIAFWDEQVLLRKPLSWQARMEQEQVLQLHDTYLMLVGFAIENLLKAIIVKNSSRLLFKQTLKEKRLPKLFKKHDLVSLSEQAKVKSKLSKAQLEYLKRLSHLIIWAGRYPIPLVSEPEKSGFPKDRVATSHTREYSAEDISEISDIVQIVSNEASIKNPLSQGAAA